MKQANLFCAIGAVYEMMEYQQRANEYYEKAIAEQNDWSVMSYYQGLAWQRLGRSDEALQKFKGLGEFGQAQLQRVAVIDYFATSLPTFLILEDDLQQRNQIDGYYLIGLGNLGQGHIEEARQGFAKILELDVNHVGARTELTSIEKNDPSIIVSTESR